MLAVGIKDITPWVMFINAAMIVPALPLSWLRWFWWRFNIWGELFGLVISVPLASVIWFGFGASAWPFWQPVILLLGIGLAGSVIATLLTRPESNETLRAFYLKVRPPGRWGPLRNALAAEGLIDPAQQRREFTVGFTSRDVRNRLLFFDDLCVLPFRGAELAIGGRFCGVSGRVRVCLFYVLAEKSHGSPFSPTMRHPRPYLHLPLACNA